MSKQEFTVNMVKAGSFSTRYLEAGVAGKPVLMLLHDGAYGATAESSWRGLIAELGQEFHIFAPELLGWGGTDKAVFLDRSPYAGRLPHLADFVEAVGIDSALYVGSSFGGSLILRGAIEAGNPLRMRGGISISGTGGPYREPAGMQALAEFTPSLEAARELTQLIIGHLQGMDGQIEERYQGSLIPGHWECMAAPRLKNPSATRSPVEDTLLQQLAQVDMPLLLVEGRHDPLLESGWAHKMAALSARISAEVLDAGHQPNIDMPETIAALVRRFAAQVGE